MPRPNPSLRPFGPDQTRWGYTTYDANGVVFDDQHVRDENSSNLGVYMYYRGYQSENAPSLRYYTHDANGKRRPRGTYVLPERYYNMGLYTMGAGNIAQSGNTQHNETSHTSSHLSGPNWAYNWTRPSVYISSDELKNAARQIAINRLRKAVSGPNAQGGIVFAERYKTADMIANAAWRVAHGFGVMKRGDIVGGIDILTAGSRGKNGWSPSRKEIDRLRDHAYSKRFSNLWLESQFGWKPLLQDVRDQAEAFAARVTEKFYHTSATGHYEDTGSVDVPYVQGMAGWHGTVNYNYHYRLRAKYRLDSYAVAGLNQTGFYNPAVVAWDLLPYSFVVDWFLPVGNYLQSLSNFAGFELVSGSESWRLEVQTVKNFNSSSNSGNGSWWVQSGSQPIRDFIYERSPLSAWPSYPLPSFRNPMDNGPAWKFVTSMGLMRQHFGR